MENKVKDQVITDRYAIYNSDCMLVMPTLENESNQVLGMAECSVRDSKEGFRFGFVSNLIVHEDQRRIGIGEALMRHAVDYFKRNHIQIIRLASKSNKDQAANIFFKKLGFQEQVTIFELQI